MKIRCPECDAEYTVPDQKILGKEVRATCKKCGARMAIRGETGEVRLTGEAPEPRKDPAPTVPGEKDTPIPPPDAKEKTPSVISMSPEYPRYRDPLIFGAAALLLVIILAAGFILLKGSSLPSLKNAGGNPVASLFRLFTGGAVYDACGAFVRDNERLFSPLGKDIRLSLIRQEVRFVSGRKTARVVARAEGKRTSGQIYFRLRKEGETWSVVSAALRVGKGKFVAVYPP
ncbi:MAG: zinc-ribbon domain-containing protein [Deltaproteobacteria bacterium]|nr:zinc-ribbon domain-containing protein [Deltaproteobacteria bacterium]MBW2015315.1 zinc-ribbon domain-containing protein [Deltaproteobacteria bacterium]MBW2127849.1 zinc-ribbon domain-containing protein [Deltaproteobacteria bacterium]MBW2302133.1 zinc-ribbon domain-containing protein [Deltaproteobacteria bacterium]